MRHLKTYESNNNTENYYAIRWLNLPTKKFGEAEGRFKTLQELIDTLGFDPIEDFDTGEFKIVSINEKELTLEDLKLHLTTKKFNM